MNLLLRAVYYCYTNNNKWGKGLTIEEAKKNCGLKAKDKTQYIVQASCLMNPTDEQLKEIEAYITADPIGGSPVYYRTKESSQLISELHVGWLVIEKNFKDE